MAQYDDLNVSRIFTVGVISVVVTAVTALAVQVFYFSISQWHLEAKSAMGSYQRQNEVLNQQTERISVYGVDEETGKITIPIDKAIELVVAESKDEEKQKDADKKASNDQVDPSKA
ncbi:hypothetical protein [Novipirellula rosea]|uniref:Uncharacterized protein n=1 Tax=Novipirellula rosea TaxID=1031540 RepID=A0ABP8MQ35_9BACT|tara:strand:+ start:843 stop:1190 length:348 start_codon:yes stop_codon:yes gene_type:complete